MSRRAQTWLARLLGVVIALGVFVPATLSSPPAVEARSCTGWTSRIVPPDTIRVLLRDGRVVTVDFKKYVGRVMTSEWGSYLPMALLRAGAQASKQFAWYHALKGNHRWNFVNRRGQCYDVVSTTRDQIYKHWARPTYKQRRAVNSIWSLALYRNDRFLFTPYRAGWVRRCAADVDGRRLYAKSARRCARLGWSAERILRTYYRNDSPVALVSGPVGGALSYEAGMSWASDEFRTAVAADLPLELRVPLDTAGRQTAVVGHIW